MNHWITVSCKYPRPHRRSKPGPWASQWLLNLWTKTVTLSFSLTSVGQHILDSFSQFSSFVLIYWSDIHFFMVFNDSVFINHYIRKKGPFSLSIFNKTFLKEIKAIMIVRIFITPKINLCKLIMITKKKSLS